MAVATTSSRSPRYGVAWASPGPVDPDPGDDHDDPRPTGTTATTGTTGTTDAGPDYVDDIPATSKNGAESAASAAGTRPEATRGAHHSRRGAWSESRGGACTGRASSPTLTELHDARLTRVTDHG